MGRDKLSKLEDRINQLEQDNMLLNRIDPAVALNTSLHTLGNVPSCGIHNTDDQGSILDNVAKEVTFNTITWDTDGMADLSDDSIVITQSGLYLIVGHAATILVGYIIYSHTNIYLIRGRK